MTMEVHAGQQFRIRSHKWPRDGCFRLFRADEQIRVWSQPVLGTWGGSEGGRGLQNDDTIA